MNAPRVVRDDEARAAPADGGGPETPGRGGRPPRAGPPTRRADSRARGAGVRAAGAPCPGALAAASAALLGALGAGFDVRSLRPGRRRLVRSEPAEHIL